MICSTNLVSLDRLSALGQWDLVYLENQSALPVCLLSVFHFIFYLTWIFWLWKSHARMHPYPECYWNMIHLSFNSVYWCFNPFFAEHHGFYKDTEFVLCHCLLFVSERGFGYQWGSCRPDQCNQCSCWWSQSSPFPWQGRVNHPAHRHGNTNTHPASETFPLLLLSNSPVYSLNSLGGGNQSTEQTLFWYGFEDDNSI